MSVRSPRLAALASAALLLAACGLETERPDIPHTDELTEYRIRERYGTVFGPDTLVFSTDPDRNRGGGGSGPAGIGVNAYLWRASLDTLEFMPLSSADPFGGVIITEWYQPPASEGERFKLNVFITDTQLRADAVSVAVFRQVENGSGGWRDAAVPATTERELENTILTRARELRISAG